MAAPTARSTRQLLGELDALMDQMLSLPVEEGAAPVATIEAPARPTAPPIPRPQAKPPIHPLAVTMTLLDLPAEPETESLAPNSNDVEEPVGPPSLESSLLPAAEPEAEPPAPSTWVDETDLVPDPSAVPTPTRIQPSAPPPAPRPLAVSPPQPIRPLPTRSIHRGYAWALRLNRMLARRTYGLGFLGRLLRSDVGRTILGVIGILMSLIAVGWLLKDLLHWT